MMKKRHILHWAMGVVLTPLLGSCAADDVVGGAGRDGCDIILGQPMTVTSVTRAVDGRTSSNFESGEEVCLWANKETSGSEYIQAWKLTAQGGGSFNGTTKYWPSDGSSLDVYAIHGNFKNSTITENSTGWSSLSLTHTVEDDQSSDVNKRLSDLLYSHPSSAVSPNSGSVQLTFDHLLAKITVKLDMDNSQGISDTELADAEVTLTNIQPEAQISSSSLSGNSEKSNTTGSRTTIIAGKPTSVSDGAVIGSAIVPLQSFGAINSNKITIKLTDNRSFSYTPADVTLGKGNEYIYTLKIIGKRITGTLSVSPFDTADKSISFNDYFDYLADLKNRSYLGSVENPHDLSYDYNGQMNTANCYVVTHPGYYKFPLVYGNAIKNGATNSIAYGVDKNGSRVSTTFVNHLGNQILNPYIYENTSCTVGSASLVWQDAPNLISNNIALCDDNKYIKFEITKENIEQGNAVIAVKDVAGTIMWSWHIWVTNKNVYETVPVKNATGYTNNFMPIPLGWDDDIADKPNCTFYQWGRKDPFVGSDGTNIDVCKTWYDNNGTKNTSILINDNSSDRNKAYSIKNPAYYLASKDCWDLDIDTYDNWNGNLESDKIPSIPYNNDKVDKTIYDPNPAGYKMPTTNAFIFTNLGEDGGKNINACGSFNKGWNFYIGGENKEPIDFWAACGYRANNSNLTHVELRGYYWTSGLISSTLGIHLRFDNDMTVYCHGSSERAYGFAVRPVSE